VVIADSFGRPWRLGQADIALGCAGIAALDDWRGRSDAHGRELTATAIAVVDELAAAADLVRDKDSGIPGAILGGLEAMVVAEDGPGAVQLQRPAGEDLFL
jgi:coenzyme F420-0:L-glutamate ligase/coenzyme F420-1:gamma-L-glutamate ligase